MGLLVVATAGNLLGSLVNYLIGLRGVEYLVAHQKISPNHLALAKNLYERYGGYTLLLSWVPLIGDPLTLAAGAMRYDLGRFILIVGCAKFARYALLIIGYGAI